MTKDAVPARIPRRQSKKLASIESRIDRLVARARRDHGEAMDRLDLIEGWILDLMIHLNIRVSELIEASGDEPDSS